MVIDPVTGLIRRHLVLVTVNHEYHEVFLNWLIYYQRVCKTLDHLQVLSLDKSTMDFMRKRGISALEPPVNLRDRHAIWSYRMGMINKYLEVGIDIVQTDIDAIWLQDPFPWFRSEAGIVGSQGKFPPAAAKVWGTAFCMGFMYFKSSPVSRHFLNDFVETLRSSPSPDDQRDFNLLLLSRNATTIADHRPQSSGPALTLRVNVSAHQSLTLEMLPREEFVRYCKAPELQHNGRIVILHCHTNKVGKLTLLCIWPQLNKSNGNRWNHAFPLWDPVRNL